MNEKFLVCRKLMEGIFNLQVQILSSEQDIKTFCHSNVLHTIQHLFDPKQLKRFFQLMKHHTLYQVKDELQMQFLLVKTDEGVFAAGPFCTCLFSKSDCLRILTRLQLPMQLQRELNSYRAKYPLLNEHTAIGIAENILKTAGLFSQALVLETLDYTQFEPQSETSALQINYRTQIEQHYAIEKTFMKAVQEGDTSLAIESLRKQQQEFLALKKIGTTLENERIACAIVRTMVRICALNAGLPPMVIDSLSRENTIAVQNARTVDEIYDAKERMTANFCNKIKQHRTANIRADIVAVIEYLNHFYAHPLEVKQIAQEFHRAPAYLSAVFKEQTGQTILHYLRKIRTAHAAHLLSTTKQSISEISIAVGISDPNYFVKLFKADYGLSPTEYRSKHSL